MLLRAGLWVGLAFQAKMMQAWLILPALLLPYLLAATAPLRRRLADAAAMLAVAVVVSLAWVVAVWCVPAADRPWIDGSASNNPFAMVFLYDGAGRFGLGGGLQAAMTTAAAPHASLGWNTLVSATYAGQISRLLPFAVLVLAAWLFEHRDRERTDPVRAGYLLWGGWLLIFAVVISFSGSMHGYYLAVLAPPVCALFGGGLIHRWQSYSQFSPLWWMLPCGIAVSTLWAVYLGANYTHFLTFLSWVVGPVGLAAACVLALRRPVRPAAVERAVAAPGRTALRSRVALSASAAAAVLALLISPAGWALSTLSPAYASTSGAPMAGPAGTLYAPVVLEHRPLPAAYTLVLPVGRDRKLLAYLKEHQGTEKYLAATQAAAVAEPYLRAGGGDFLVLGGFTGLTPNVTAAQFSTLVADDTVRYALLSAGSKGGPVDSWITGHCLRVAPDYYREKTDTAVQLYDCRPSASGAPRRAARPTAYPPS
jgi:4-amino-4-deoxy-L-arabinose transferase-like glycosyltransferase